MSDKQKRSQEVLRNAEKAIAKIADPTLRAKAVAKLQTAQKKISVAKSPRPKRPRAAVRDREVDQER